MALFQKTVEQRYLKQLNAELINVKFLEFKTYSGDPTIQENIRNSESIEESVRAYIIGVYKNQH